MEDNQARDVRGRNGGVMGREARAQAAERKRHDRAVNEAAVRGLDLLRRVPTARPDPSARYRDSLPRNSQVSVTFDGEVMQRAAVLAPAVGLDVMATLLLAVQLGSVEQGA